MPPGQSLVLEVEMLLFLFHVEVEQDCHHRSFEYLDYHRSFLGKVSVVLEGGLTER